MEKDICKNVTHVNRCCTTRRIVRLMKIRYTHLCAGKGFQLSLAWESIRTHLSYSGEATKQEVTFSCRSVLVCRAVSDCAVASSLPGKLSRPLWEDAGGRSPSNALRLHPSPGQRAASRNMPSALTHRKARDIEGGVRGCDSEEAALAKLLLGVGLHYQRTAP